MERFTVRKAMASYLGVDPSEVEERRYQPTRTPCAIYTDGHGYYTATAKRAMRGSSNNLTGTWDWVEVPAAGYWGAMGWRVWRAVRG